MSREYARFKQVPANMTNKALCAISKRYIRDNRRVLWVPTDRVVAGDRSAYPNDSPCGRLTREAVHPEELCGGWEEVYRLVRLIPKMPKTNETITNMTKSLYHKMAVVIDQVFFGNTYFGTVKRRNFKYVIDTDPRGEANSPGGRFSYNASCAYTNLNRGTEVNIGLFRWAFNHGNLHVISDGFHVYNALDWLAHTIGHEMVHYLKGFLCGAKYTNRTEDPHGPIWSGMNKNILGGRGHTWVHSRN
jgi:hypothetical protein